MTEELQYTMQNVIALAELEKQCFGRDAWSIAALRGEFGNDFSHFLAEVRDGEILGYVCVRTIYEEAQICNIAVAPQHRRQGIGTALLKACLEFSSKVCQHCELEVNTENAPAVALYKKCGFEVAGIRKNFYRKSRYSTRDAYTMIVEFKPENAD